MRAVESRGVSLELSIADLDTKMEDLGRDLGDIKRMLVLLQHRTVALSLMQAEEPPCGWWTRLTAWMRRTCSR